MKIDREKSKKLGYSLAAGLGSVVGSFVALSAISATAHVSNVSTIIPASLAIGTIMIPVSRMIYKEAVKDTQKTYKTMK